MGFWTDCINPFHKSNHGFWSDRQIYSTAKLCPLCWYLAGHKEPITVPAPLKKTRLDATPEKNTL